MTKLMLWALVLIGVLYALVGLANAETVVNITVNITGDTYVDTTNPDTDFSSLGIMTADQWPANRNRTILLRFNITDIPKNVNITDATLRLIKADGAVGDLAVYDVSQVNNTWTEDTVTWTTWNNTGGFTASPINNTLHTLPAGGALTPVMINLTNITQSAFDAGLSTISFSINRTSASASAADYYTQLNVTPGYRPLFTLSYQTLLEVVQETPNPGLLTTGVNLNMSCFVNSTQLNGNITNVTFHMYFPNNTLNTSITNTFDSSTSNAVNTSVLYNATIEGNHNWFCEASSLDGIDVVRESSINRTFLRDANSPFVNLTLPSLEGNRTGIRLRFNTNDTSNTFCVTSIDGGGNLTVPSAFCVNDSVVRNTTINHNPSSGQHSFTLYVNDTLVQLTTNTTNFFLLDLVNQTNVSQELETTAQTLTITLEDTSNLNPTVTLRYNNTDTTAILAGSDGVNDTYQVSVTTPPIPTGTLSQLIDYNWTMSSTVNNQPATFTWPNQQQNVSTFFITHTDDVFQCINPAATDFTANFTFRSEANDSLLPGINFTASYWTTWVTSPANALNFSWNQSIVGVSSYPVCIFPGSAEIFSDVKILYEGNGLGQREFNLQSHAFNNVMQNFTLYLEDTSLLTTFTITVQDENGIPLNDYLVKAFLTDFSNFTDSKLVESKVTDPDGVVTMDLVGTDYYRFEVWKDNTKFHEEGPYIIKSTSHTITVILAQIFDTGIYSNLDKNIATTLTYNNVTGNITGTWIDTDGLASEFCLRIFNRTQTSFLAHSNTCTTGTTGSLTGHIGNSSGIYTSQLLATAKADNLEYVLQTLDVDLRTEHEIFGREGLFWFGLIATPLLFFLAAFSPQAAVIASLVGLTMFGYIFDLYYLAWGSLIFLLFLGAIFIISMKK